MSAYPGIELVDFKGDPRDLEDKQTVAIGSVQAEHEQKQITSSQDNTDTSVSLLNGGAYIQSKDSSPGRVVQGGSNRSRRAKWWKIVGIAAVVIVIVVCIPVGVIVARNRRWVPCSPYKMD